MGWLLALLAGGAGLRPAGWGVGKWRAARDGAWPPGAALGALAPPAQPDLGRGRAVPGGGGAGQQGSIIPSLIGCASDAARVKLAEWAQTRPSGPARRGEGRTSRTGTKGPPATGCEQGDARRPWSARFSALPCSARPAHPTPRGPRPRVGLHQGLRHLPHDARPGAHARRESGGPKAAQGPLTA